MHVIFLYLKIPHQTLRILLISQSKWKYFSETDQEYHSEFLGKIEDAIFLQQITIIDYFINCITLFHYFVPIKNTTIKERNSIRLSYSLFAFYVWEIWLWTSEGSPWWHSTQCLISSILFQPWDLSPKLYMIPLLYDVQFFFHRFNHNLCY